MGLGQVVVARVGCPRSFKRLWRRTVADPESLAADDKEVDYELKLKWNALPPADAKKDAEAIKDLRELEENGTIVEQAEREFGAAQDKQDQENLAHSEEMELIAKMIKKADEAQNAEELEIWTNKQQTQEAKFEEILKLREQAEMELAVKTEERMRESEVRDQLLQSGRTAEVERAAVSPPPRGAEFGQSLGILGRERGLFWPNSPRRLIRIGRRFQVGVRPVSPCTVHVTVSPYTVHAIMSHVRFAESCRICGVSFRICTCLDRNS